MKVILLIIAIISVSFAAPEFTCLDNEGNSVDWWVSLKLPNLYSDGNPYFYYDSSYGNNPDFTYHDSIIDKNSAFLRTLKQIDDITSPDYASVFWNDGPPDQDYEYGWAHSKGFIGAQNGVGFIMNHSTPKFPRVTGNKVDLYIESGQRVYGQHFFCMNVDYATINNYAKGLQLDKVQTFDSHVPSSMEKDLPELVQLMKNLQAPGTSEVINFQTRGGLQLQLFAKSGEYDADFYYECVAKHYELNFDFETWGKPMMDATCKTEQVVGNLNMKYTSQIDFSYTYDHSKFGISTNENSDVVCFGDINRMTSQFTRGGGTNCFHHKGIHDYLNIAMNQRQQCFNKGLRGKIMDLLKQ